jgi:hypothetical protein
MTNKSAGRGPDKGRGTGVVSSDEPTASAQDPRIGLYQQMSDLTAPECANECWKPHSCCEPMYCEFTIQHAADKWGVKLEPTGHPTLPLMGPTGCTAAPHLRPICTIHTCAIQAFGVRFKSEPDTPNIDRRVIDEEWTADYFRLRDALNEAEESAAFNLTAGPSTEDVV